MGPSRKVEDPEEKGRQIPFHYQFLMPTETFLSRDLLLVIVDELSRDFSLPGQIPLHFHLIELTAAAVQQNCLLQILVEVHLWIFHMYPILCFLLPFCILIQVPSPY